MAELKALDILNEVQKKAMKVVVQKSKPASEAAFPRLVERLKHTNFTEEDLRKVLRYIRDKAPIIIHVDLSAVLQFFVKDTHYRNQFETNSSRGTLNHEVRRGWERRLFDGAYDDKSVTGFDRAKYGVLNIVNDPNGISSCVYYGDSFFILKKVRLRTSFANKDSSSDDALLACCEYYCHVLESFDDSELKAVMDVGLKFDEDPSFFIASASVGMWNYKEIQIHGPIAFNQHIAGLRVNVRHKIQKDITDNIRKFCNTNNISDVKYIDGSSFKLS